MSQAGIISVAASGGSGIKIIDGDVGSVSGTTVTLSGVDESLGPSGAVFTGAGDYMGLSFNSLNMFSGSSIASINIDDYAMLSAGPESASITDNLFVGPDSGTFLGATYTGNVAVGVFAWAGRSGINNTIIGTNTLQYPTSGPSSYNTVLGYGSGSNYTTTESSNILIGPNITGTAEESNVIRIGNQGSGSGEQNICYIAGIVGNTVSNAQYVTINSSTGQLGVGPGTPASAAVSVSDDFWSFPISQLPWIVIGNGTWTFPASLAGHPGIISSPSIANIVSDTTTGMYLGNNTAAQAIVLGGGQIQINWVFNIVTLSNGTNRYGLNVGFGDTQGGAGQANGVYFSYSDNVNSGDWQIVTSAASTKTTTSTAVAVTTGWHDAQIVVNAGASSVTFTLDGVSLGTITTHIPTLPMSPFWGASWVAGTIASGTFLIDLFEMTQTLTTPR